MAVYFKWSQRCIWEKILCRICKEEIIEVSKGLRDSK